MSIKLQMLYKCHIAVLRKIWKTKPGSRHCTVGKIVAGPKLLHIINSNTCYGLYVQWKISKTCVNIGNNVVNMHTKNYKIFLEINWQYGIWPIFQGNVWIRVFGALRAVTLQKLSVVGRAWANCLEILPICGRF